MTQREYALKGEITQRMIDAAKNERLTAEDLCLGIAQGTIALPGNIQRNSTPKAIGKGCSTKVNANIGTSGDLCCLETEIKKAGIAEKFGADALMDLSIGGDLDFIRKKILAATSLPLGTVPLYGVFDRELGKSDRIEDISSDLFIEEIERQAIQGVDFMTIHAGITRRSLSFLSEDRLLGIVSRGGALMRRWILKRNEENPLYSRFDEILEICRKYDVTVSLGDSLRPGAGEDAGDGAMMAEMLVLGELVEKCLKKGVQVIVEGPGHMPLDQVQDNVRFMKKVCHGAPYYVLGPLVIDNAAGYDHIAGAIGGAIAAAEGADFLCYLTPAEHLALPNEHDVKEGVIASRIAAQAGDLVKGAGNAREDSAEVSRLRNKRDWKAAFPFFPDPEAAEERSEFSSKKERGCSMCGNLCSIVQSEKAGL